LEKGKKVFDHLKSKTSQYSDCYDTIYEKNKGDSSFEKMYSYLSNPEYLEYIYYNVAEEQRASEKKEKVDVVDDEGFIKIKKK